MTTAIEEQVLEMLVSVTGVQSISEIGLTQTLVHDLGLESLDFVEISYLIEKKFGVILETRELMQPIPDVQMEDLFTDGKLSENGLSLLTAHDLVKDKSFHVGMTKIEMFGTITVSDLANLIEKKLAKKSNAQQ